MEQPVLTTRKAASQNQTFDEDYESDSGFVPQVVLCSYLPTSSTR